MRLAFIAFAFLCSISFTWADLKDGLVSYWPFEGVGSETTPDTFSNNHLYLYKITSASLVPGRFGNAVLLNGRSQFLALNYATHNELPLHRAERYTIAFWVKGGANQTNKILFAEGSTLDRKPLFLIGTDRNGQSASANVLIRNATTNLVENVPCETVVLDDHWHHLAWVDDNGSARLYIDGVRDVVSFQYNTAKGRLNYLSIGALLRTPPDYFFKGEIDELAIWKRALSELEIRELMQKPLASRLDTKP